MIVDALVDLLRRRIGLDLTAAGDVGSLGRFVAARVGTLELQRDAEYVELLEGQQVGGPELDLVIAAVTNPHTFFFRDETQFRAAGALLSRRQGLAEGRPLALWCAGCATGEEPFSLAMICADRGLDVRVVATDINQESLAFAREGRYKSWSLRRLPAPFVERYFTREDADTYRVAEGVRRLVSFERHNLMDAALPAPPHAAAPPGGLRRWDCILCRNVLMYFHRPAAQRVLEGFASSLGPEGWLFLSSSEHLHGLLTGFQLVEVEGSFAYRVAPPRAAARPAPAPVPAADRPAPPARALAPREKPLPRRERLDEGISAALADASLYRQALGALGGGDTARARELLERQVAAHPEHLVAWITLGNLRLKALDLDGAFAAYENARERDPLLPEVHYLQGVVYRKLGDLTRAIHAFRRALFLDPRFWCAAFALAGAHGRAGNVDRQRRDLRHALELLEAKEASSFFSSHVEGMKDVCISPVEALRHCRRELGRPR